MRETSKTLQSKPFFARENNPRAASWFLNFNFIHCSKWKSENFYLNARNTGKKLIFLMIISRACHRIEFYVLNTCNKPFNTCIARTHTHTLPFAADYYYFFSISVLLFVFFHSKYNSFHYYYSLWPFPSISLITEI